MKYNQALKQLQALQIKGETFFNTLGGRNQFKFSTGNKSFTLMNSGNSTFEVDENIWNLVSDRYDELDGDLKHKATQYTADNWKNNNPSTVFSPYIAAIIKEFS